MSDKAEHPAPASGDRISKYLLELWASGRAATVSNGQRQMAVELLWIRPALADAERQLAEAKEEKSILAGLHARAIVSLAELEPLVESSAVDGAGNPVTPFDAAINLAQDLRAERDAALARVKELSEKLEEISAAALEAGERQ